MSDDPSKDGTPAADAAPPAEPAVPEAAAVPAVAAPAPPPEAPAAEPNALSAKLQTLGLTEAQVQKLIAEGATSEGDVALLTADQIKQITECGTITAAKIVAALATPAAPAGNVAAATADPHAEVPEGATPSPSQINAFAAATGMPLDIMPMLFMGTMMGQAGGAMDLSGMIPVATVLDGYNPKIRNPYMMVMTQLEQSLGGAPIVVINEDGSVNKPLTVEYITRLQEGHDYAPDEVYFDGDGVSYDIIKVGVDAQSIYDSDPLNSEKALQANGMGLGNIRWKDVSLEVKQIVHFAVKVGELSPNDETKMQWLRDTIKPGVGIPQLRTTLPQGLKAYREAYRTGEVPMLRVQLSRSPRRAEYMARRRPAAPTGIGGRDSRDPRDL